MSGMWSALSKVKDRIVESTNSMTHNMSKPELMAGRSPVNKLLFPTTAVDPTYGYDGPIRVGDMEVNPGTINFEKFKVKLFWVSSEPEVPVLYYPCEKGHKCIIYCHGNAEDMWNSHQLHFFLRSSLNTHICAIEYPGYAICPGRPSELTIHNNLTATYNFLTMVMGFEPSDIILFGRSIGTGVCTRFAATNEVGGLILLSPFSSIRDLVNDFASENVGSWSSNIAMLISDRFVNRDEIKNVRCSTLVLHGTEDALIPYQHAEVLYECCGASQKDLCLMAGMDHDNCLDEEHMRAIVSRISRAFDFASSPPHQGMAERIPRLLCNYMTVLHPQLDGPDFASYLCKQGKVEQSWERKWFILKESFIWYMASHLGSPILGVIPLEGATVKVPNGEINHNPKP